MTDKPFVLFALEDDVATLTLNRPESLNALSAGMIDALQEALVQAETQEARCVILTGSGRGFCSGADLAAGASQFGSADRDLGAMLESSYHPLLRRLRDLPCPVITAVNGPAAGAGMSVSLMGDLVIAAKSAYFLQAFVNIGLVPDAGSTYLLPRLIGAQRARELFMLGEKLPAEKAAEWGMIHQCVADDELADTATKLAQRLAKGPTKALAAIRALASASLDNDYETQLTMERDQQRNAGRTQDFLEGVAAFMQKRPAKFTGK